MNLINFSQSDFDTISKNYIDTMYNAVCNKTNYNYVGSFYFKKAKLGKFFSKQEDIQALKYFLSEDNESNYYQIIQEHHQRLDKLFLDVIFQYAENFVFDKRCSIYAKRLLNLRKIKKEATAKIIVKDNNPIGFISIQESYQNRFTGVQHIEFVDLLLDKNIKKTHFHTKKKYFGKDFLSTLFKIIKKGNIKLEEIDIETFFEEKDQRDESKFEFIKNNIIKITENQRYFNAKNKDILMQKKIENTTLNKKNFNKVYSYFLNQFEAWQFIPFLEKNKINQGIYKNVLHNNEIIEIMKDSTSYVNFKKAYRSAPVIKYKSIDEFLTKYKNFLKYKESYIDISKSINPRKFSLKTKKELNALSPIINLLPDMKKYMKQDILQNTKHYIIEPIQVLIDLGISEKTIRGLFLKILNKKNFFNIEQEQVVFNNNQSHDIISTTLSNLNVVIYLYKDKEFKNKRVLNSLLLILHSINLDSSKSLITFNKVLEYMKTYINLLNELIDEPIKNIQELNVIISNEVKRQNEELIKLLKNHNLITDRTIKLASNIDSLSNHLKLMSKVTDKKYYEQYFENSYLKEKITHTNSDCTVEITPHNDEFGILGANVPGVCISSYSDHRLEQLNKNFLNLIVYDKNEKLMLWGLLCRLENDKNEIMYVLNNLQGSVNDKKIDIKSISNDIIFVLQKLIKQMGLNNVLTKDHGFNAIKIMGDNKKERVNPFLLGYELCQKTRLDFAVDSEFYQVT